MNGIISVSALDISTEEKTSVIVNGNKGRLSQKEIDTLISEAKQQELDDNLNLRKKMLHFNLMELGEIILENTRSSDIKKSEDEINKISLCINELMVTLKSKYYKDHSIDYLESTTDNIKNRYGTLILRKNENYKVKAINSCNDLVFIYDSDSDEDNEVRKYESIKIKKSEKEEDVYLIKKKLNHYCYYILDLLNDWSSAMPVEERDEIKDVINDTLLWGCSCHNLNKTDILSKLDDIDNTCNKIFSKYINVETKDRYELNTEICNLENTCLQIIDILTDECYKTDKYFKLKTSVDKILFWISEKKVNIENLSDEEKEKVSIIVEKYQNDVKCICNEIFDDDNDDESRYIIEDFDTIGGTSIANILE